MDLPTNDDVVAAIEAFLDRHDMKPTRFGREATGDANLVADLRRGVAPKLDRLHRIRDFITIRDREAGLDHVAGDIADDGAPSPGKTADLSTQVTA